MPSLTTMIKSPKSGLKYERKIGLKSEPGKKLLDIFGKRDRWDKARSGTISKATGLRRFTESELLTMLILLGEDVYRFDLGMVAGFLRNPGLKRLARSKGIGGGIARTGLKMYGKLKGFGSRISRGLQSKQGFMKGYSSNPIDTMSKSAFKRKYSQFGVESGAQIKARQPRIPKQRKPKGISSQSRITTG